MEKVHGANKGDGKIELFNGEHSLAVHSTGKILYPIEKFGRKRKKSDGYIFFFTLLLYYYNVHTTISLCLYISADSCFFICQDDVTFMRLYSPTEPGNIYSVSRNRPSKKGPFKLTLFLEYIAIAY
jgi:hypothetical protein